MSSQKHIQDELKSLESGLPTNNNQPFSVPDGYFEGLAASVLAKVKSCEASAQSEVRELSPLLAGIPKIMPYSVPFSYFEQNTDWIPDVSSDPELSFLETAGKKLPYGIPQGYFDTLPQQMLSKVAKPEAKVVPLFARKWMRMAAAAVVGGALFVAGYQYFTDASQNNLANKPADTSKTLVASRTPVIEQEIKTASTKELEDFIQNVQVRSKADKIQSSSSDKENVKELLKDVSDKEMESFLSALPVSDDELLLTD